MAKFDPLIYNYELIDKQEGVYHFQKILLKENCVVTDIIELAYWSKQDIWVIYLETINLKQFLPKDTTIEECKMPLFIGEIKNDFDYQFQMKRICMDPKILIQMGA